MLERVGHGDLVKVRGVPVPERAPRRREDDLAEAVGRQALHALKDGAVLGVGGDHVHPRLLQQRQDHRPARDERLLVGQGDVLAGLDGSHRGDEAGTAHDARDHRIRGGHRRHRHRALLASQERGHLLHLALLAKAAQLRDLLRVLDGHHLRPELLDLVRQQLQVAACRQAHDAEVIRPLPHDVQRLRADGASAAQQAESLMPLRILQRLLKSPENW
eukprot:scaffold2679_cov251-Pinguiococcus_pyrenoidosus.AAC.9